MSEGERSGPNLRPRPRNARHTQRTRTRRPRSVQFNEENLLPKKLYNVPDNVNLDRIKLTDQDKLEFNTSIQRQDKIVKNLEREVSKIDTENDVRKSTLDNNETVLLQDAVLYNIIKPDFELNEIKRDSCHEQDYVRSVKLLLNEFDKLYDDDFMYTGNIFPESIIENEKKQLTTLKKRIETGIEKIKNDQNNLEKLTNVLSNLKHERLQLNDHTDTDIDWNIRDHIQKVEKKIENTKTSLQESCDNLNVTINELWKQWLIVKDKIIQRLKEKYEEATQNENGTLVQKRKELESAREIMGKIEQAETNIKERLRAIKDTLESEKQEKYNTMVDSFKDLPNKRPQPSDNQIPNATDRYDKTIHRLSNLFGIDPLELPKNDKMTKESCPTDGPLKLKTYQELPAKVLFPEKGKQDLFQGLLLYWSVGTGKTIASMNVVKQFLNRKRKRRQYCRILFLVENNDLIKNLDTALKKIFNEEYEVKGETNDDKVPKGIIPVFKTIYKKNDRVNKVATVGFISFDFVPTNKQARAFVNANQSLIDPKNLLIIVDEVHLMFQEYKGPNHANPPARERWINVLEDNAENDKNPSKVLLMTATPGKKQDIEKLMKIIPNVKGELPETEDEFVNTILYKISF